MSIVDLEFEWDENKNQRNIRNHRIHFALAAKVFEDLSRIPKGHPKKLKTEGRMYYNDSNPDDIRTNHIPSSYRRDLEHMVIIKQSDLPPITEQDIAELEEAARHPITFDEDCPEMTPEMLSKFRRVNGGSESPIRA